MIRYSPVTNKFFLGAMVSAIFVGSASAQQLFPVYHRQVSIGNVQVPDPVTTTDPAGNWYFAFYDPATHADVRLLRYDPSGNLTLNAEAPFGEYATQLSSLVYSNGGLMGNGIGLVGTGVQSALTQDVLVTFFDVNGNREWEAMSYPGNFNNPLSAAFTNGGYLSVANQLFRDYGDHLQHSGTNTLSFLYSDQGNHVPTDDNGDGSNTGTAAAFAGNFVLYGGDVYPKATANGVAVWAKYSVLDQSGTKLIGGSLANTDNGTIAVKYSFSPRGCTDGTYFIIQQTTVTNDKSSAITGQSFIISKYLNNNTRVFTSAPFGGVFTDLTTTGAQGQIFVAATNFTLGSTSPQRTRLNALSPSGTQLWNVSEEPSSDPAKLVADANGAYLLINNQSGLSLDVFGFNNSGAAGFTNSVFYPKSGKWLNCYLLNGDLYTAALTQAVNDYETLTLDRQIVGPFVSQIESSSTVKTNNGITVQVDFSLPSPRNGTILMTSSSPSLLFPNNSTTYSLPFATGANFGKVNMHATGTPAGNVVITANGDGVVKKNTIAVSS
jgi:hypothetical protein